MLRSMRRNTLSPSSSAGHGGGYDADPLSHIYPDTLSHSLPGTTHVLQHLERVATSIERELPRALPGGDAGTDRWFRTRAREIAASVRHLKRAVLTPMADSQEWFLNQVGDRLRRISDGDWDNLPREHAEAEASRPPVSRILSRLWSLAVGGALPVGLVLLFERAELLTGPAATTLPLAAFAFAALTVMLNLDPTFQTTFGVLKEVAPWLGLPGAGQRAGAEHGG